MDSLQRRSNWIGLTLLASLGIGGMAGAAGEKISFRFNPPHKTTYIQTYKSDTLMTAGTLGQMKSQSEVKERTVITKTAGGFTMSVTFLNSTSSQNGKAVPDPSSTALKGTTITYVLDKNGILKSIRGFDTVSKKMGSSSDPKLGQAHTPKVNEKLFTRQAKAEWAERYGALLGKTLEVGKVQITAEPHPMKNGKYIKVYSTRRVQKQPDANGHKLVLIRTDSDSDPKALAKTTGVSEKTILAGDKVHRKVDYDSKSGAQIRGFSERLLDPTTMLNYSEKAVRRVTMPMPGTSKALATATEQRVYTYKYEK